MRQGQEVLGPRSGFTANTAALTVSAASLLRRGFGQDSARATALLKLVSPSGAICRCRKLGRFKSPDVKELFRSFFFADLHRT
jgi:hypothetical protein